jgi:hypothetical protein
MMEVNHKGEVKVRTSVGGKEEKRSKLRMNRE